MKETLKMTVKEAERLSVMRQVNKKVLTIRKAREELGLSLRQTKRVRKRYKKRGGEGLISLIDWPCSPFRPLFTRPFSCKPM